MKRSSSGYWMRTNEALNRAEVYDSASDRWVYMYAQDKWKTVDGDQFAKRPTSGPATAPGAPVQQAAPAQPAPQPQAQPAPAAEPAPAPAPQAQRRPTVDSNVRHGRGVSSTWVIAASVAVVLAGGIIVYALGIPGIVKLVDFRSPVQATVDMSLPKSKKQDTPKQELPKREVKVEEQPAPPVVNNDLGRDRFVHTISICAAHNLPIKTMLPGSAEYDAEVKKLREMSMVDYTKHLEHLCHTNRNIQPPTLIRDQNPPTPPANQQTDGDEDEQPTVRADLNPNLQPVSFRHRNDRGDTSDFAELRKRLDNYKGPRWTPTIAPRNTFMNKQAPANAVPCSPPGYNGRTVLCVKRGYGN
jgi:hypothetical protein